MIKGIGVDIVEIKRIDLKIADRVLSVNELEIFKTMSSVRQKEFLAGRFAIKEAIYKAGIHCAFSSMDIKYKEDNSIYLDNYPHVNISITHEKEYAIGFAINND